MCSSNANTSQKLSLLPWSLTLVPWPRRQLLAYKWQALCFMFYLYSIIMWGTSWILVAFLKISQGGQQKFSQNWAVLNLTLPGVFLKMLLLFFFLENFIQCGLNIFSEYPSELSRKVSRFSHVSWLSVFHSANDWELFSLKEQFF